MPEQALARPYAFEQVRDRPMVQAFRPSFEVSGSSGVPDSVLEPARAEARASGYAAGWAQGVQEARAQLAADVEQSRVHAQELDTRRAAELARALAALDRAATELEARAVPTVERLEDTVASFALRIAEALVGHDLATSNRTGLDALARVLKLAAESEPITVQLSTADYEAVVGAAEFPAMAAGRSVTLVALPSLADGDALARCGATEIDARIEPALARVRALLS